MPGTELGDPVAPAMTADLLGAPPPVTAASELSVAAMLTLELDAAGPYREEPWNRWWPPCAFPCIGDIRASPKMATQVFIMLERALERE